MVPCSPRLPPRDEVPTCRLEEPGLFLSAGSLLRQELRLANKGAAGGGRELTTQPLMNLFPLISGVSFEGKGRPRQLECPCLSSLGVLLLLPGHSFDTGLPDSPRVGLT